MLPALPPLSSNPLVFGFSRFVLMVYVTPRWIKEKEEWYDFQKQEDKKMPGPFLLRRNGGLGCAFLLRYHLTTTRSLVRHRACLCTNEASGIVHPRSEQSHSFAKHFIFYTKVWRCAYL